MSAFVARRNPLAVLAVTFSLLVPVLLSYDRVTPLVFLGLGLTHLLLLGGVGLGRFLKVFAPLSLLSVGLLMLNVLFPQEGVDGFHRGTAVFLRSLTLIALSVGYILIVDPHDLINALMQQLGLPPRAGFALFAGWNAIPLFRRDLKIIEKAQAVRFGKRKRSCTDVSKTAVVLLAGAIRHGERVALSMAARGIEEGKNRTYYRKSYWTLTDSLYCAAGVLVSAAAAALVIRGGAFIFELG